MTLDIQQLNRDYISSVYTNSLYKYITNNFEIQKQNELYDGLEINNVSGINIFVGADKFFEYYEKFNQQENLGLLTFLINTGTETMLNLFNTGNLSITIKNQLNKIYIKNKNQDVFEYINGFESLSESIYNNLLIVDTENSFVFRGADNFIALYNELKNIGKLDSLSVLISNDNINIPNLTLLISDDNINISNLALLISDGNINISNLVSLISDGNINISKLALLISNGNINISNLALLIGDDNINISNLVSLISNGNINISNLAGLISSVTNISNLALLISNNNINIPKLVSLISNGNINISNLAGLISSVTNISNLALLIKQVSNISNLVSLISDGNINIPNLALLIIDDNINIPNLALLISNNNTNIPKLVSLISNGNINISNLALLIKQVSNILNLALLISNDNINISNLALLISDYNINISNLARLISNANINISKLARLISDYNINISNLALLISNANINISKLARLISNDNINISNLALLIRQVSNISNLALLISDDNINITKLASLTRAYNINISNLALLISDDNINISNLALLISSVTKISNLALLIKQVSNISNLALLISNGNINIPNLALLISIDNIKISNLAQLISAEYKVQFGTINYYLSMNITKLAKIISLLDVNFINNSKLNFSYFVITVNDVLDSKLGFLAEATRRIETDKCVEANNKSQITNLFVPYIQHTRLSYLVNNITSGELFSYKNITNYYRYVNSFDIKIKNKSPQSITDYVSIMMNQKTVSVNNVRNSINGGKVKPASFKLKDMRHIIVRFGDIFYSFTDTESKKNLVQIFDSGNKLVSTDSLTGSLGMLNEIKGNLQFKYRKDSVYMFYINIT